MSKLNLKVISDEYAKAKVEQLTSPRIVRSGVRALDNHAYCYPGTLTLIGAQSGVGKTTMLMQYIFNTISNMVDAGMQGKVLLFSGEMNGQSLLEREAGYRCGEDIRLLHRNQPDIPDQTWRDSVEQRIGNVSGTMESIVKEVENHLVMYEGEDMTRQGIAEAIVEALKVGKVSLVAIDYLGLVGSGEEDDNPVAETRKVAEFLGGIALKANIPIIATHQHNRSQVSRKDKQPTLADLDYGGDKPASTVVSFWDIEEERTLVHDVPVKQVTVTKNRFFGWYPTVTMELRGGRWREVQVSTLKFEDELGNPVTPAPPDSVPISSTGAIGQVRTYLSVGAGDWYEVATIVNATDLTKSTVKKALQKELKDSSDWLERREQGAGMPTLWRHKHPTESLLDDVDMDSLT